MKLTRKISKNPILAVLLSFSILFMSCNPSEVIAEETFSGKELFKGIFLLDGEVSKKIDYYQPVLAVLENEYDEDPSLRDERDKFNQRILEQVESIDPAFFDKLESAINSKNINRVEDILKEGATLMKTNIYLKNIELDEYKETFGKMDISEYNLSSEEGITAFIDDYEELARNDRSTSNTSVNSKCLAFAAVVAVAIWEVIGLINVAVEINIFLLVFALTEVASSDDGGGGGGGGGGADRVILDVDDEFIFNSGTDLGREKFITQLTFSLNP